MDICGAERTMTVVGEKRGKGEDLTVKHVETRVGHAEKQHHNTRGCGLC